MVFDPRYPDTSNSLNRVVIADLPGELLPSDVKGKTGYDLLSSKRLKMLVRDQAMMRGKDLYTEKELFTWFYSEFKNADLGLGYYLGCLLVTLVRGDEVNRKARPEWTDAHWKLWGSIRTVHLGGGLVIGGMGSAMAKYAQTMLRERAGFTDFKIDVADYPQHLPLLGAARYIPSSQQGYIFDFGGTYVKRGLAQYGEDGFQKFTILSSVESKYPDESPATIRDKMVEIIVDTLKDFDADVIPISIAAYVDANGQPLIAQGGIYMQLAKLSNDIPSMLSEEVSEYIGKQVQIKLLHDGSAAASYYAPEENAAVIMLGTAIGSGYCVPRPELRAVSPHLSIVDVHGG
jgi:hypothetical protein